MPTWVFAYTDFFTEKDFQKNRPYGLFSDGSITTNLKIEPSLKTEQSTFAMIKNKLHIFGPMDNRYTNIKVKKETI